VRQLARSLPILVVVVFLAVAPVLAARRRAFVTSTSGTGDLSTWAGAGGAAGLAAADNVCRARATAASLPNAGSYRAWLSDLSTDAYCHVQGLVGTRSTLCNLAVEPGGGPWFLVNGVTNYTGTLDELTQSPWKIYRPVELDESGTAFTSLSAGRIWTGTSKSGSTIAADTCQGWTSASSGKIGLIGSALGTAEAWTNYNVASCDQTAHLLCLEPGTSETVTLGWSPGGLAFVTSASGGGKLADWPQAGYAAGYAAGYQICENLAAAAHLPALGSYVPWLSVAGVDAIDSLTLPSNAVYRRVDGYSIGSKADLASGLPANSLHVDEKGAYASGLWWVLTGTAADGTAAAGNCANWSSSSASDVYMAGIEGAAKVPEWTAAGANEECAFVGHLYCFSNVVTLFWDGFDLTGDTSRWSAAVP